MLRSCRHHRRIHHPSASDAWIFKKIRKWLSRRTRRCSVLSTYCAAHGCPYAPPLRGDAARAHARSAAPASSLTQRVRSLVDAARRAGLVRRRPAERPRRVRVGGPHAQGVGRVDRRLHPDADRAHAPSAAPASSRTARQLLVHAATGAGLVRRRAVEWPRRVRIVGQHAQGLGLVERSVPPDADRAHVPCAAPASRRHNASITL